MEAVVPMHESYLLLNGVPVASLPSCGAGLGGRFAFVVRALAPAWNATLVGGTGRGARSGGVQRRKLDGSLMRVFPALSLPALFVS